MRLQFRGDYMDIGTRIKELRKGLYTAKELADAIGVTREHLSAVENNIKPISLPAIEKICEVLGITLSDFFIETSAPEELSPEVRKLIRIFNDLDEEDKIRVSAVIESLADKSKKLYEINSNKDNFKFITDKNIQPNDLSSEQIEEIKKLAYQLNDLDKNS
jgi:transcriptional regulator with XRE-family HTH domain